MSRSPSIKTAESPGAVRIVLARPPLNVIDIAMMEEINGVLAGIKSNPEIKALVIAAEGRAFSAGVSVEEHLSERAGEMLAAFHRIFRQLHALPCATVAAVHGAALGGGAELAAFCDVVIAAEEAKIGQPEITVGAFPPIAALHYPKRIGQARTLQMLMSGEVLSAREAERIGLIDRVVPAGQLEGAVEETVRKFTGKSGAVLAVTRRAVLGSVDQFERALDELEKLYMNQLMQCQDATEGLRAFLEKRPPVWRNE